MVAIFCGYGLAGITYFDSLTKGDTCQHILNIPGVLGVLLLYVSASVIVLRGRMANAAALTVFSQVSYLEAL